MKPKSFFSRGRIQTDPPLECHGKRPCVSVFKLSPKLDLRKSPSATAASRPQLSLSRGPLPDRQLSHTVGRKHRQADGVIRAIIIPSNYCAVCT